MTPNYYLKVIAGDGIGTSYSSLDHRIAVDPVEPFGQAEIQLYADIAAKSLIVRDHVLRVIDQGGPYEFYFTYSSAVESLSTSWHFSQDKKLINIPTEAGNSITLIESDGHQTIFTLAPGTHFYYAPACASGISHIYNNGKSWVYFNRRECFIEYYDDQGVLLMRQDEHGAQIVYQYDDQGRLNNIIAPSGNRYQIRRLGNAMSVYMITVDGTQTCLNSYYFNATNGLLEKSCLPDTNGYQITYHYTPSGILESVLQTDGTFIIFSYMPVGNNRNALIGAGLNGPQDCSLAQQVEFSFDINYGDLSTSTIEVSLGRSMKRQIHLDAEGRVAQIAKQKGCFGDDSQGVDIIVYQYNPEGQIATVILPDGSQEIFSYTTAFLLLANHEKPDGAVVKYSYDVDAHQPKLIVKNEYSTAEAQSNQAISTWYAYETEQSADFEPYNILRFKITPLGYVTEYRVDSITHLRISERSYLKTNFPVASFGEKIAPSLTTMIKWLDAQNPTQVALTEFVRDNRGQVYIKQDFAVVNQEGQGVQNDPHSSLTEQFLDAFGNCLNKIDLQIFPDITAIEKYNYDPLQRLVQLQNPLNEKTVVRYLEPQQQVVTTYPNGLVKTQSYDDIGVINSQEDSYKDEETSLNRIAYYFQDFIGRISVTQDATGQLNYQLYDQQQRLIFTVTALGWLSQYEYSEQHRFTKITHYSTFITSQQLFPLGHISPAQVPNAIDIQRAVIAIANPLQDHCQYEFRDPCQRIQYEVDQANTEGQYYIQESQYDTRGNLKAKIRYAQPITTEQLVILTAGQKIPLMPDPNHDEIHQFSYDLNGDKIQQIDPDGYITEYMRDVAGKIIKETVYAIPHDTAPKDAFYTYYFYDNRQELVLTVDPEGCIANYDYYPNGLRKLSIQYYNPVSKDWYDNTSIPPTPIPHSEDQYTSCYYDLLKRLIKQETTYGKGVENVFDNMSNLIWVHGYDSQDPQNTTDADKTRDEQNHYDGFSRVIAQANSFISQQIAIINASTQSPEQKQQEINNLWANNSLRHSYSLNDLKIKSVNSLNQETIYYYDVDQRLVLTINAEGGVVEKIYDSFGNVLTVHQYLTPLTPTILATLTGGYITSEVMKLLQPTAQDPVNQFLYNKRLKQIQHTDPEGYVNLKSYDAFDQVVQEQCPIQLYQPSLSIFYAYDLRGNQINLIKQSAAQIIAVHYQFNNPYGKLTQQTDALGNVTVYLYNRRGDKTQIIDPAQISQHLYVIDAFHRLSSDTDALGNSTQYYYAQNTRTTTIVKQEPETEKILTKNAFEEKITETNALGQTQFFFHAPHGQVSQVTDPLGRITKKTFNTEGMTITQQDALGIITTFFYNNVNELIQQVEDTLGLKLTTTFVLDVLGQQLQVTDPRGVVTHNQYDRRGLLIQTTEDYGSETLPGLRLITQTQYNGQGTRTALMQGDMAVANQYQVLFQQDDFNRAVGKIVDPDQESILGLKLQQVNNLDPNNRIIKYIDPKGQISRLFYDECGNKRFKVDANCVVTEWFYNKHIQLFFRRHYATTLTTLNDRSTLVDVQTWAATSTSQYDSITYFFYDHNNRERFIITYANVLGDEISQAIITETRYDGASRMIERIGYANTLDLNQVLMQTYDSLIPLIEAIQDSDDDRHTYYVLDAAGQQRFLFDPQGYAVEQIFDDRGRIISRIEYATLVPNIEQLVLLPVDKINLVKDPVNDRVNYYLFDVLDKPIYSVDPGSAVIFYQYDPSGNLLSRCRFAQTITVPATYQDLVTLLLTLIPNPENGDRITRYTLDNLKRTVRMIDPAGQVELLDHDILGNLTKRTDRAQAVWINRYDRAKRLLQAITPATTITTVSANEQGQLTATQMQRPVIEDYTYDENNNVTQVIKDSGQLNARTIRSHYDGNDHLVMTTLLNIPLDDATKPARINSIPVAYTDLFIKNVYDTKGQEIVKQDKTSWLWSFNIYDARHALLFSISTAGVVTGYKRNAFSEVIAQTVYATPLSLDLSLYATTGISLDTLNSVLIKDPSNDRTTIHTRDRRGDVVRMTRDLVYVYYPIETQKRKLSSNAGNRIKTAAPVVIYLKNAFRESYYIQYNRFPDYPELDKTKLCLRGQRGEILAEVESVQVALSATEELFDTPMSYKVLRKHYNAFNEEMSQTAFAQPLSNVNATTTLAELDSQVIASVQDRTRTRVYDLLGQLIEKSRINAICQQIAFNQQIPVIQDTLPRTLTKRYTYNALGYQQTMTDESGNTNFDYYDLRGFKIASVGITNEQNKAVLQSYGIDAHGAQVSTTYYINGTHAPTIAQLPVPVLPDVANDQTNLFLFDARGLMQIRQQPEGQLLFWTYTPNRDVARQFTLVTTWAQDPIHPAQAVQIQVIEETRNTFDHALQPIRKAVLRNDIEKPAFTTRVSYNTFGETIAQGGAQGDLAVFVHYDQIGRVWADNQSNGIPQVNLYDLQGNVTAQIMVPDQNVVDIKTLTLDQLPKLVDGHSYSDTEVEVTSRWSDPQNHLLKEQFPPFLVRDHSEIRKVALSLQVSHLYPTIGSLSIAWPILSCSYALSLKLTQVDNVREFSPELKNDNGMTGADVSGMIADQYNYILSYDSIDPVSQEKSTAFLTTGVLAIDSGNYIGSQRVLAFVEGGYHVYVVGNIAGVTALALYQNGQIINTFAPTPVPAKSALMLNLYDVKTITGQSVLSGQYTIQAIRSGVSDQQSTLPFTIFTRYLSSPNQPLSREISCAPQLLILEQNNKSYGQLMIWNSLPEDYQQLSVKLGCDYLDDQGLPQKHKATIEWNTNFGVYTDESGNKLFCNIEFIYNVQSIVSITLSLVLDFENELELYTDEPPQPLPEEGHIHFNYHNRARTKVVTVSRLTNLEEDYEHVSLSSSRDSFVFVDNQIATYVLLPKTLAYLTPFLNYDRPGSKLPQLSYDDVTQGPNVSNKFITPFFANKQGLVVNVTAMLPGNYPYRLMVDALVKPVGTLCINEGASVFSSDPTDFPAPSEKNTQKSYEVDVFGNQISETDANQNITSYTYNYQDQKIQIQYPPITVVDEAGTVFPDQITTKKFGLDLQSRPIGTIDENGHTTVTIFDRIGNIKQSILADGTIAETNTYDLFNRRVANTEASGATWTMQWDRCNRLLSKTSSLGMKTTYAYDERGHRTLTQDAAGNKTYFGYDEQDNAAVQIYPLGQTSFAEYDSNGEPLRRQDANGNVVSYTRNYFGKILTETFMNGAVVSKIYNQKLQLIYQTSQGQFHTTLTYKIEPHQYFDPADNVFKFFDYYQEFEPPVLQQNLIFNYSGGLLVSIEDKSSETLSVYGYDSNRRRVHCQITLNDQMIRTMDMLLDAKGRPKFIQDTNAQMFVSYDAADNRRHVYAVFIPDENVPEQKNISDLWWIYTVVNNVLIDGGVLKEGSIQLSPGQGVEVMYQGGLRHKETVILQDASRIENTMHYDADDRLVTTNGTDNANTARTYLAHTNCVEQYTESDSFRSTERNNRFDSNLRPVYNEEKLNGTFKQKTGIGYDQSNNIGTQDLDFCNGLTAKLHSNYLETDQYQQSLVWGQTFNDQGTPQNVAPARMYFDANNNPSGKANSDNGDQGEGYEPEVVIFNSNAEGWILNRIQFKKRSAKRIESSNLIATEPVFVSPDGVTFASYLTKADPQQASNAPLAITGGTWMGGYSVPFFGGGQFANLPMRPSYPVTSNPYPLLKQSEFVVASTTDRIIQHVRPVNSADYQKLIAKDDNPNLKSSYPPLTPDKFTVPDNNWTFTQVSSAVTGSPKYADIIAKANGWALSHLCQAGELLDIPNLQLNCNNAVDHVAYSKMMSIILGGLSPHLEFAPKQSSDSDSCGDSFFEAVISVVAVVAAVAIVGTSAGTLTPLAVGVVAGALDLGMQAVAKEANLITRISWADVLQTTISGGLAGFAPTFSPAESSGFLAMTEKAGAMALYYGAVNIADQFAAIALHQQEKLDMSALTSTLVQGFLEGWIGTSLQVPAISQKGITTMQVVERIGVDFAETIIGEAVMGTSLDLKNFVANESGSFVGGELGNPVADYIRPPEKNLAPSTKQVQQDSLAPGDSKYYQAVALGQGMGPSPDYLSLFPGMSDPHDELNMYLGVTTPSNKPAAQVKTQSALQQKIMDEVKGSLSEIKSLAQKINNEVYAHAGMIDTIASFTPVSIVNGIYESYTGRNMTTGIPVSQQQARMDILLGAVSVIPVEKLVTLAIKGGTPIVAGSAKLMEKFGIFGRSAAAKAENFSLYRAVTPDELQQISQTKQFENPYGIEHKYFSTTRAGAEQYAQMAEKAFGDPSYTIVKTTIPKLIFESISSHLQTTVDRGVPATLIPTAYLSKLSQPEVLSHDIEFLNRRTL